MIAVINDINVIDGYHNLYPKNYKIQFREIIKGEIEANKKFLTLIVGEIKFIFFIMTQII